LAHHITEKLDVNGMAIVLPTSFAQYEYIVVNGQTTTSAFHKVGQ